MEMNKGIATKNDEKHEDESLKGALFSSLVFVGGTIVAFIVIFIVIYIGRI